MTFILFCYGAFSTIFHSTDMVGNIGRIYGEANLGLFGYLAYIDLLILIYPLYQVYKKRSLLRESEFYIGWIIFFISLIILQSLVLEFNQSGTIGVTLKIFLLPYIGKAGLWLFWLLTFMISMVLLMEEIPNPKLYMLKMKNLGTWVVIEIKKIINRLFATIDNPFFDKESTEVMTTIITKQQRQRRKKEPTTIRQKSPKKITHRKKTPKKSISKKKIKEKILVEERPVEDIKKIISSVDNDEDLIISDEQTQEEHASMLNIVDELKENRELMDQLEKGEVEEPEDFELPPLDFLAEPSKTSKRIDEEEIDHKVHILLEKLGQFKISGEVMDIYSGPLVTTFEFKPAANVKVSKILNLQDDLAMALQAETIRIQAPIPGRDVIGIEIPNESFDTIYLRDILENEIFTTSKSPLTIAMGKDIVGNPFVTDLKKLPHLLIAGTTGSGKSVGINAMILSLLYRNDPDSLKLMLIDPKMLEFSIYNDIPHLLTPVITDANKAIAALANMVAEMERRYKLMAESRTKNIDNYNEKIKKKGGEQMPFIVVIIDELADLMMTGGKEVEYSIARLAQMARASGIHLIVATQRPSVDVVTGLIKANLPSRLSYRVGQRIDSKVILDALGADTLLGRGDALFTPPGANGLVRLHAPWNSEEEIEEVVEFLKAQREPEYDDRYLVKDEGESLVGTGVVGELDELYEQAKEVILNDQKTSISYLQRKLQIGYNRSANIIEQLQEMGVLSAPNNKGQRDILL
jgi:S-DNA-T family DNA segregation ATPase FtsK/SpoIIIE